MSFFSSSRVAARASGAVPAGGAHQAQADGVTAKLLREVGVEPRQRLDQVRLRRGGRDDVQRDGIGVVADLDEVIACFVVRILHDVSSGVDAAKGDIGAHQLLFDLGEFAGSDPILQ